MSRIVPLPYCADPVQLFECVADQPWAVLLDGGRHDPGQSRYDVIAAEPWATLVTRAPDRACRKKVRCPGSPTVPAMNRSGGSNRWTTGGMRRDYLRAGPAPPPSFSSGSSSTPM